MDQNNKDGAWAAIAAAGSAGDTGVMNHPDCVLSFDAETDNTERATQTPSEHGPPSGPSEPPRLSEEAVDVCLH